MDNSITGKRKLGLTGDTSNALHQTLTGLVELIKVLLEVNFPYVLPGKIPSDSLEGEILAPVIIVSPFNRFIMV